MSLVVKFVIPYILAIKLGEQRPLSAIVQARHLSLFGRIAHLSIRNRCKDLNSFPPGELEETTRTPSHHVDEDYPAGPGII